MKKYILEYINIYWKYYRTEDEIVSRAESDPSFSIKSLVLRSHVRQCNHFLPFVSNDRYRGDYSRPVQSSRARFTYFEIFFRVFQVTEYYRELRMREEVE